MPQINKGGKFVFGWSVIQFDSSLQIPFQAIEEYNICSEQHVILISGSKRTGGFSISRLGLLENTVFQGIFELYPDFKTYSMKQGCLYAYKGRYFTWLKINKNGKIILSNELLSWPELRPGEKLLSVRSSNIAFTMGLKGPLIEVQMNTKEAYLYIDM